MTTRDHSRSTHHNTGTRPLYFQPRPIACYVNGKLTTIVAPCGKPRFLPGPNVRKGDWTASVKLTMALLVVLILALWWAFLTFTR